MSVVTGGSEPGPAAAAAAAAAGGRGGGAGGGTRVFFQSPRGGSASREDSVAPAAVVQVQQQRRHQQGKVTVKYDRKELRKRLVLEEWIVEQLGQLYGCEEEEMPDVEIDIDDLLDAANEEERALKLQEALVDCYKPTEPERGGYAEWGLNGEGFYQRTSDSDKRDEETKPSSKKEHISEDGASWEKRSINWNY